MSPACRALSSLVGQASRRAALRASPVASSSRTTLRFESTTSASADAAVAPKTEAAATHYRITLRRSGIGLPEKTNRILTSLGLKKRLQSIYRPIGPESAGAILAVKELVHVDNVRRLDTPEQQALSNEEAIWVNEAGEFIDGGKASRKAPRGYTVVGNLIDEARDRAVKASKDS